jgi:uncharacterized protein YcsI (UPF0317 family)
MEPTLITLINTPIPLLTWEQANQVSEYWNKELSRGAFEGCDTTIDRAIMELGLLNRHLHLTSLRRQQ